MLSQPSAPTSSFAAQNIDVSYNSLSGLIPDALLGIPDADTADAQLPFHYLQSVKIFQQWGSRMCAHVHSNANIPAVPPRLDLGNASSPIASDILKYMKGQAAPVSSTDSQACDRSGAADALLRAAGSQLSENVEWLGGGVSTMLTATPFFMFPWDQDQGQTPQEVFIGLCDLPEMLSLAYAPPPPSKSLFADLQSQLHPEIPLLIPQSAGTSHSSTNLM